MITADHLRKVLHYDPSSGIFTWLVRSQNGLRNPGDVAGFRHHNGYTVIKINSQKNTAGRLAWLYIHGKFPDGQIDHINGDRTDDKITNLRDVSPTLNAQNRRIPWKSKKLKIVGVHRHGKKYRALIRANGKQQHLGIFNTAQEAEAAYIKAKRALHAGCTV